MKLDRFTVGKRYGKAIFELSMEANCLEDVYQELLKLREVYEEVPDLGEILTDVRLESYEKQPIVDSLKNGFSNILQNFISVVHEYNRMDSMPLMIDEFEHRYNEEKKIINGTVTTAVAISPEKQKQLEEKFAAFLGYHTAHLKNVVDPEIIGGVIVEADHQVVDGSLRTQLDALKKALL